MIAELNGHNYTKDDARWGKYDSGFHAWLVECVDPDEHDGDTDYGGIAIYGKRVDSWDTHGFHYLQTQGSSAGALDIYQQWLDEYLHCDECGGRHGFEEGCE